MADRFAAGAHDSLGEPGGGDIACRAAGAPGLADGWPLAPWSRLGHRRAHAGHGAERCRGWHEIWVAFVRFLIIFVLFLGSRGVGDPDFVPPDICRMSLENVRNHLPVVAVETPADRTAVELLLEVGSRPDAAQDTDDF